MRIELKEALQRIYGENRRGFLPTNQQAEEKKPNGWRRSNGLQKPARRHASVAVKMSLVMILAGVSLYAVIAGVYYYNRFSVILVDLDKYETLVDNELKRRANLLPNLLIICAEYRTHEKRLYEHVSEMRSHLANLKTKAPRDTVAPLSKLLSSLLAIAEEYPDLKATQSFEKLMGEWAGTENRIANARALYIESIRELNALCTTFPSNLYAKLFRVDKRDPFSFREQSEAPISSIEFFSAYSPKDTVSGEKAQDADETGRLVETRGEDADLQAEEVE